MHTIDFDELSAYFDRSVEDLKEESYVHLEALEDQMRKEKAENQAMRNAKDVEFIRLTKKYFSMWHLLTRYWTEAEVIAAVAKHMNAYDLVEELAVRRPFNYTSVYIDSLGPATNPPGPSAEFIRISKEHLPVFKNGEELARRDYCLCDVWRVQSSHQDNHHGEVVLELLYNTFPELREFNFRAYRLNYGKEEDYEIYPTPDLYTPLKALLAGDLEAIRKRNFDYCSWYNHGEYTVAKVKERLASEEGRHYFDVITKLDRMKLKKS